MVDGDKKETWEPAGKGSGQRTPGKTRLLIAASAVGACVLGYGLGRLCWSSAEPGADETAWADEDPAAVLPETVAREGPSEIAERPKLGTAAGPPSPSQPAGAYPLRDESSASPSGESTDEDWQPPQTAQQLLEAASRVVHGLIERYPADPYAHAATAEWLSLSGQSAQSAERWKKCLELNDRFTDAYFGSMRIALREGDYEQVLTLAGRALELAPASVDARNLRADALLGLGRAEEAVRVLQESLKENPKRPSTHDTLGKAYLLLEKYQEAKDHYQAAVEANPNYVRAYEGLASVCAKLGQEEEAEQHLQKYNRLRAKSEEGRLTGPRGDDSASARQGAAYVHVAAGKAHFQNGEPLEAQRLWSRAARIHSADLESRRLLATVCQRQGKIGEALRIFGDMAAIDPGNPGIVLRIGTLHGSLRQFDQAERAFQKVCQLAPHRAIGYAVLSQLYLDAGRKVPEATPLARKAVEIEPTAINYSLLSEACRRNDDLAGARAAIEEALRLDPQNASYKQMHQRLQEKQ